MPGNYSEIKFPYWLIKTATKFYPSYTPKLSFPYPDAVAISIRDFFCPAGDKASSPSLFSVNGLVLRIAINLLIESLSKHD